MFDIATHFTKAYNNKKRGKSHQQTNASTAHQKLFSRERERKKKVFPEFVYLFSLSTNVVRVYAHSTNFTLTINMYRENTKSTPNPSMYTLCE